MINKILGRLFPPYKFKLISKEQNVIFRAVIDSLPSNFNEFKLQVQSLTFHGLTGWELFPDYKFVYLSYPENTINEFKKKGQNYKLSGIEIFSNKNQKYENVELLVNDNLLSGFRITNSEYFLNEFDLTKINFERVTKSEFDFPPNEVDLFYDSLNSKIKSMLNPDNIFDIDYNNKTFYAFHDMEDGNYLAVDKKQNVYSLVHDVIPAAKLMDYSLEDILTEIAENKFDIGNHIDNRHIKSR